MSAKIRKYVSIQPMLGVKLSIIMNENMSVNDGGCKAPSMNNSSRHAIPTTTTNASSPSVNGLQVLAKFKKSKKKKL